MKLNEALEAAGASKSLPLHGRLFLVCGFEPLHLPAFLQAHHARRFPGQGLAVSTGLYGDLEGNLARAVDSDATLALVILEWSDLDSRLGLRSTGSWSGDPAELARGIESRLGRLAESLRRLGAKMPVVLSGPTLPFTLAGHTTGWQSSPLELLLEHRVATFLASFAGERGVQVLSAPRLAALSPSGSRRDTRLDIAAGFPFSTGHASVLAEAMIALGYPAPPKKGLITDLDDTLWAGLVGEIGAGAVAWSQAAHAQVHGLYQSMLRQLVEGGVLVGVASKNELGVVEAALARQDLMLEKESLFPVRANWGPKSAMVTSILSTWNIGADSVVLVDDSRMELEEVRSVHPEITCLQFSPKDPAKCLGVFEALRDLFGKPEIGEADRLRGASVRNMAKLEHPKTEQDMPSFLAGLAGKVSFDPSKDPRDGRLLELINKTNQWNINGVRIAQGDWLRFVARQDSFAVGVSYADRYGALGTIAVIAGVHGPAGIDVEHWVLSCRAFSRRIEDHILHYLLTSGSFEPGLRGGLSVSFRKTEKNRPVQEFLARLGVSGDAAAIGGDPDAGGRVAIARALALEATRDLPHAVHERLAPQAEQNEDRG